MMTSVELIETLDSGSENNPSQDYSHPDNEITLMLHHWSCFGVTDLGRGNKFLGLAFPQEMKPPLLCYLPNTPPSFRLSVYVELLNLRIKAQSPKIKTLDVKMEHAHLQFWLSTK